MTGLSRPANRFGLREAGGAVGDLGTLLPLSLAAIALAGLSATTVLAGFGLFYIATGVIYRLPIPVQPMKAVIAVVLVAQISPAAIALSGIFIGVILLALGGSGLIDRIGRLVPQSVMVGLQLGLGLGLGWIALGLMYAAPLVGALSLATAIVFLVRRGHAALATLGAGLGLGALLGAPGLELTVVAPEGGWWFGQGIRAADLNAALVDLALPQMALTLTNAILLTALVARDRFGELAAHVTPRRLCLTSGAANLLLAPLGALPMCHGAGGLAAHYRFGARTGGASILIGLALIAVAILPPGWRAAGFAAIPVATLGALLLVAACELAISRRLFDCNPSCRPVIAATAAGTVLVNPLAGLAIGTCAELVRKVILRGRRA